MGKGGIFATLVRPQERQTLRAIRAESRLKRAGISKYNKRFRSWAQMRVRKYQLGLPVVLTTDTPLMDPKYITACVQKAAKLRKHDVDLWKGYAERVKEIAFPQFSLDDANNAASLNNSGIALDSDAMNNSDLAGMLKTGSSSSTLPSLSRVSGNLVPLSAEQAATQIKTPMQFDPTDWGYIFWAFGKSGYLDRNFYDAVIPNLREDVVPNMGSHGLMSLMW
jgi:hypothetical protein